MDTNMMSYLGDGGMDGWMDWKSIHPKRVSISSYSSINPSIFPALYSTIHPFKNFSFIQLPRPLLLHPSNHQSIHLCFHPKGFFISLFNYSSIHHYLITLFIRLMGKLEPMPKGVVYLGQVASLCLGNIFFFIL